MTKANWLNLLFFGFAVLGVALGLVFIWVGGQINYLACTRLKVGRVDCELQRQFLWLVPTSRQILPRVTGTEVKEDCLDGCRYWVEIFAGDEAVRLTNFSSYNRQGVIEDQERIALFLDNPGRKIFEFTGSPSWGLLISSVPLIVVGGILVVSYSNRIVVLS